MEKLIRNPELLKMSAKNNRERYLADGVKMRFQSEIDEYIKQLISEIKREAKMPYLKRNRVCISENEYLMYCLEEIRNSKSYKIGRAITWFPRKIRGW